MNIDVLGISELKWTGMGEFNSDYNYTVEVTNRFKGLDLIDRVPEELWTQISDIVQEARQIGSGQTRDGKSECRHSRNQ